eukprot:COSAG01_NODE_13650_length_1553_cov_2.889959_2_plen_68_part_00
MQQQHSQHSRQQQLISCGTTYTVQDCIDESIMRVVELIARCDGDVDVFYSVDGVGCWGDVAEEPLRV